MNEQCYVSMPFGRKWSDATGNIDFDRIYQDSIRPVLEKAGLSSVRSDEFGGGIIHEGVFRQLLDSELMIADLTLGNPNVIYELGLRHALRPSGTVIILGAGTQLPFSLSLMSAVTYPLADGRIPDSERDDFAKRLTRAIEQALSDNSPDSPFYGLLPEILPPTQIRDSRRASVGTAPATGSMVRQQAIESVRSSVEKGSDNAIDVEPGIPVELYLAELRRTGNQLSIIEFASSLPPNVAEQGPVVREVALALRRRDEDGDLDRAIDMTRGLLNREGTHPETLGVLGRLCKTRYEKSGEEEDLIAAIEAYRRAFELDNATVYFGATALGLMMSREGIVEDQAFLSRVRRALESKYEDRSFDSWDYWDLVTGVELAVYARDWEAAARFAWHAGSLGPEEWQIESMSLQLKRVRQVMPENDQEQVSKLLDNWGALRTAP